MIKNTSGNSSFLCLSGKNNTLHKTQVVNILL